MDVIFKIFKHFPKLSQALSKIKIELNREKEEECQIKQQLQTVQLALEKSIIERTKLKVLEDEIATHEEALECFEEFYAENRKDIEEKNADNTIKMVIWSKI